MDSREPPISTLPRSSPPSDDEAADWAGFARLARRRGRRLGLALWVGLLVLLLAL